MLNSNPVCRPLAFEILGNFPDGSVSHAGLAAQDKHSLMIIEVGEC